MFENLFINWAFHPDTRFFYFATVISVVISITLHELAHGWAAIRLGDDTPIRTGHMTGNPLVHMGPFALVALFLAGISWGSMPVDHTRLRGRHAEAWVAFAGPGMNFLLAAAALTGLGLWIRFAGLPDGQVQENARIFLRAFGGINAVLGVFNLFPVPPLDGSRILGNLNRRYALFIDDPAHQGLVLMAFLFLFAVAGLIFQPVFDFTRDYTLWVATGRWG